MEQPTTAQTLRKVAVIIDTALAPLYAKGHALDYQYREAAEVRDDARYGKTTQERYATKALAIHAEREALYAELDPLEQIARAGKWTRYIYVPGGHVHRFSCSTLFPTTDRVWLPEYSGSNEAEVVEAAADRACTVCFPSAPVDRPSTIPALVKEREEREAEAAAKIEAKRAAAAAQIVVGRKVYKGLRAAENEMSWHMENVVSRSYVEGVDAEHTQHLRNLAAEDREAVEAIADAAQAVYPEWDRAAVLAKKFAAKAKEYRKAGLSIPADASY